MKKKSVLSKAYDPEPVEEKWSLSWIEEEVFVPDAHSDKPKFSMVLPPPNVTGSLHMGHALCFTLPDIIARWRRMKGFNVLWLPGTDHASIAVHNVIEKKLIKQGLDREKIGREEFLKVAWEWKETYGGVILHQLKKMGFSLDWTRERFTMDEGFSRAVNKVFVDLYREGLIYRDYYLVNRCPRCGTVLSDVEIEHKDLNSRLYYVRYPMTEGGESLTVATTRPETMLGDTAVAVHPEDERYLAFHGKRIRLPLTDREIPIILDERVEREFGTGAVKVTPAHDPVDFELGKKHKLPQIIVIDGFGKMTEAAGGDFEGLDRFECRDKVIERLEAAGLMEKIEDHQHAVGHCYRCKTVIEPHLSWQWFVKIEPLAREAIRAVEEGEIRFIPENWTKTYYEWMYNIHDWCISRQLWWGHRIPAWYCSDCGEIIVETSSPETCPRCQSRDLRQDEDVLDTWFSSALWPFGTLGWPDETPDLKAFYPTDLMATGFDIIFFWVARMIMMGLKFRGRIPFRDVFINGLVRDFKKRKMSKSEGNSIDPLEMIDKYGTDALRFTLAALAIPGMDISLSEERMAGYRAFVNKLWNASRFVIMNLDGTDMKVHDAEMTMADRWIRSRLSRITEQIETALEQYRFYEAADLIYHFLWHEYCDWYIELVKPSLQSGSRTSLAVLVDTLDRILRLLHPFMPFVTEEIWQHLPSAGNFLAAAAFPSTEREWRDDVLEADMKILQDAITEVRTIRAENRISPQKEIDLWIKGEEGLRLNPEIRTAIRSLANVRGIEVFEEFPQDKSFLKGVVGAFAIPLEEGLIDLEQERQRLERELAKAQKDLKKMEGRLENRDFRAKAPREVVLEVEQGLEQLRRREGGLQENLKHLRSLS